MVDQLWLWILDGNTIITSFPRRWGRNRHDPSEVHESLRERLKITPSEEIQSIYDLALIIIDQCSRVFFDPTRALDQRPEVMDIFSLAIGRVMKHTIIARELLWRKLNFEKARNGPSYLDINPEAMLLRESQEVAEELQIMLKIFDQQLHVVRDFRNILGRMNGESKNEAGEVRLLVKLLRQNQMMAGDKGGIVLPGDHLPVPHSTIQGADDLVELIGSRKAEIQDFELTSLKTAQQLQDQLALKRQQLSISEAKSALISKNESIKQNNTIMALTLVTIFFVCLPSRQVLPCSVSILIKLLQLPLGFLAAFFGMNNEQINQASWMTLNEQIKYMFAVSTGVIAISVSIAFSPWAHAVLSALRIVLTALIKIPILLVLEHSGMRALWKRQNAGLRYLEIKNQHWIRWINDHGDRRKKEKMYEKMWREGEEELIKGVPWKERAAGKVVKWLSFREGKTSGVDVEGLTRNTEAEGDERDIA